MERIFALTTRGLEAVSAAEMASLPHVQVIETSYRRIAAHCTGPLDALLQLRTVDDVFLAITCWPGMYRQRSTLVAMRQFGAQLDLRQAAVLCSHLRPIGKPPSFSVTANFVGQRNYGVEEMKEVMAMAIQKSHGWPYRARDQDADLNLRIFIEHEIAFVGIRLHKRPLQERPYRQAHLRGALKPTIAAALLWLDSIHPQTRLLDPCCGTGTILLEAAILGFQAQGGDIDPAALNAVQTNAAAAGVAVMVQQWDVQKLPLGDACMKRIVSNLPWNRQVPIKANLHSFHHRACAEMRRVLAPGGQITLLTDAPHLLNFGDLRCTQQIEISLFGQTPTVAVFLN
ncbi:MAG: methyltransferase domain-containing protein [Abitibacteriaceae bacterium]|nr:methyltransferase domain-containing protein [Abditibacteriaceae bacterium]MBV9868077.1 methyltransferase domain-containing protein [Abditibacteriaceae bacterium]